MNQKTQFIADYLRETLSVSELCDLYDSSRETAYKWIERGLRASPFNRQLRAMQPVPRFMLLTAIAFHTCCALLIPR
jgi:putative transposase